MFVVTGSGRSGIAWLAEGLRARGIRCGEKKVFRYEHALGRPYDWADWQGDSTNEVVPLLPTLRPSLSRVVLVVRDCEEVCASWMRLGAFGNDHRDNDKFLLWGILLDRDYPGLLDLPTPIERARAYWHEWNRSARQYADVELNLRDLDLDFEPLVRAVS